MLVDKINKNKKKRLETTKVWYDVYTIYNAGNVWNSLNRIVIVMKRIEFAPKEVNFFSFSVKLSSKGKQNNFDRAALLTNVSILLKFMSS